jgi:hypothetical protein
MKVHPFLRSARRMPPPVALAGALGRTEVACVLVAGQAVPAGCVGVLFDPTGRTVRSAAGSLCAPADGQSSCCFHPGPYEIAVAPYAQAPEAGLQLTLALDLGGGSEEQARFDQYLAAECGGDLSVEAARQAVEALVQAALAQGQLSLPPCPTQGEWHGFRSGLNRLLYLRFGWSVDECLPADLGDRVDFAAQLRARAAAALQSAAHTGAGVVPTPMPAPRTASSGDPVKLDAAGLRRLFIELPRLARALRQLGQDSGRPLARRSHALQERLARLGVQVNAMPALGLAAPGRTLAPDLQRARAACTLAALDALDRGWALAAGTALAHAGGMDSVLDAAERIVEALEQACKGRRNVPLMPAPVPRPADAVMQATGAQGGGVQ